MRGWVACTCDDLEYRRARYEVQRAARVLPKDVFDEGEKKNT